MSVAVEPRLQLNEDQMSAEQDKNVIKPQPRQMMFLSSSADI